MIKRYLFDEVKAHLHRKEISFIVGPRQSGKTTLMKLLQEYLEKSGEKTLFFNLDIEMDKEHFASQSAFLRKIELEIGKNKGYVFIDEIQRKENAGVFLKGLYDMNLPYKFIVSGSGSIELKSKIHESLAGRKRIFELTTVSFREFINYKTNYKYEGRLMDFFSIDKERGYNLLMEYLNFGGYPRVVLEDTLSEKLRLINEIYQSYIERDISYLLNVHKTDAFTNLVKLLSSQIGRIVNYTEISSTLGLSFQTVKEYMWYLEKTFIVQKVTPYFKNVRKEISKSPIYYFYDIGLRNFAVGSFGHIENIGFVFQNFIYNILKEKIKWGPSKVCFWRTKDKSEVDFVVDYGRGVLPIEVKYQKMKIPKITKSLRSFIKRYQPERALIVNLELETEMKLDKTVILFIPFFRLLEWEFFPRNGVGH